MKKILVITDMDSVGSGYKHICAPLLTEIMKLSDYDIKVIGFMYRGEEHWYPFSVIPAITIEEAAQMAINLIGMWNPDVVVVAMDLPIQQRLHDTLSRFGKKYIGITPLENGPLCLDWAVPLFSMDGVFFISQLGTDEAHKVGVTKAEHLQVGCDTVSWHPATPEEKKQFRDGLGIAEDAFVVLTVADNQERKNLWAGMDAVAKLKSLTTRPIKYILVTREHNPYGNKLRSLATSLGIQQELMIFERGMPQKDLWALYAVADAYLQPSKAEGLGLPVLDAMCCKIPVVATKTGAMTELLEDGRGFLVEPEYTMVDVWGNSVRNFISREMASKDLQCLADSILDDNQDDYHLLQGMIHRAHEYVQNRKWEIPAQQLHNKIMEIVEKGNEQP